MSKAFDDAALADMIDRYSRGYAGRIEILPDAVEVSIDRDGTSVTYRLVRGSSVAFERDGFPIRHGILRLGVTIDGHPFGIIAVPYPYEDKEFRIPLGLIQFTPTASS